MSIDYTWCPYSKPKDQNKVKLTEKPVIEKKITVDKKTTKSNLKAKTSLKSKTKLQSKTPVKKVSKKKSKTKRPKKELCIMPQHTFYKTKREEGLKRHEVFFGSKQRDLSIKYGLVIFIRPEQHTIYKGSIHMTPALDEEIKQIAQKAFEKVYPELNFREVFGKNYL
jgi:hypothetical protein